MLMTSRSIRHTGRGQFTGARALAIAAGLVLCTSAHADVKKISDERVTSAVEAEFWADDVVDANRIDTRTTDGVVTLEGEVSTILAKQRAARIAATVVGVRAIVNRIQVAPSEVDNDSLERGVKRALLKDPAADSFEVSALADDGVVTLKGTVDSWQEKQLCAAVTMDVRGVREVRNEIDVDYAVERTDSEIRKEVEARLRNDVLVDDELVTVTVKNGRVTLAGKVGSLAEKLRAQSDAWVGGVDFVNAKKLTVEWWARDSMRRDPSAVTRTDEQIKKAVEDALLYDPRVFSFNPDVRVERRKVTLTGVVDNLRAKRAAEENARNVVGVWRVVNHLKVRPVETLSNEKLAKRVRSALRGDPFIDRWDVDVAAHDGIVYLTGDVNTSFERARAERAVESVVGVVDVINALDHVHAWTWKSDQEIREDVKEQMFWSPFVDAEEITVDVEDGIVTLIGAVDSWSERLAAEENAFEGGAKDVRNELDVTNAFHGPYYGLQ